MCTEKIKLSSILKFHGISQEMFLNLSEIILEKLEESYTNSSKSEKIRSNSELEKT